MWTGVVLLAAPSLRVRPEDTPGECDALRPEPVPPSAESHASIGEGTAMLSAAVAHDRRVSAASGRPGIIADEHQQRRFPVGQPVELGPLIRRPIRQ